ncbi:MAG TPA: tetraacyldisaccharide 4'-kinase [Stellaceae bacterium]|nr:tetraacyldisaccharide 4'-kinase [Stellaceae bacterium]
MRAPDFWHAESGLMGSFAAGLLAPVGSAWGAATRLRRAIARPYRAAVPVVCVGNLVAGGAGKTPVVLALLGHLTAADAAVQVVTRGYGGRLAGPMRVDLAAHDAATVGDEALLIAAQAPCWVARDRAAGIRAAAAAGAALILLDDGLQNPGIATDLSLVVVDAEYGFGNCRLIPAGPLREPVATGLARADAVVLIGEGELPLGVREAARPVLRATLDAIDGARFAGARVVAFAGIGRPDKFFHTLRELGADLVAAHAFADHHPFTAGDIARLRQEADRAGARLVTTAKDFVRLPPDERAGIAVLEVEIRWHDPAAVMRLLPGALAPRDEYDRSAAPG